MFKIYNLKSAYLMMFIAVAAISFSVFNGCDDAGTVPEDPVISYVEHFDSIGVVDGIGDVANSINLLNGTTVTRDSASKDVQLVDSLGTSFNFMLRSGDLSDFPTSFVGFQTRFNRIYSSMTQAEFDTITMLPVGRDTILPDLDFTADDTYGGGAWGYFNAPMSLTDSKPVYSFWLKGKSASFTGVNIYGILYPREAANTSGFRMSFEVRINTRGLNDFKHIH